MSKTTCKRDSTGRFLAEHDPEVDILYISIALIGLRSAKGMGVAGLVEVEEEGVEVRVVIKVLRCFFVCSSARAPGCIRSPCRSTSQHLS
jgi:hypothetical protein